MLSDLTNIVELLPCLIYWKNTSGVYLGCNQNLLEAFNLKNKEGFIGKSIDELLEKNSAQHIKETDRKVMLSKTPCLVEETIIINGRPRNFISNKVPLFDNQKEVTGLLGVSFEVTESQLHGHEAIKQKLAAEKTLNKIINLLPGHIYWYDLDGTIYGMNDQQAHSCGFKSANEGIGVNAYSLVPKKYADSWYKTNEQVVKSGKTIEAEEIFYYPDGREAPVLSKKSPWYDENGKIIGVIGISLDITEQKKIEHELLISKSFSENALKRVITEFPGNFYWFDKTGLILGCNDNQATSLGLKAGADLIGLNLYDFVQDHFSKNVLDSLKAKNDYILKSGETVTFEEEVYIQNQKITYLSKKSPLRNEREEIIGIIGLSFDITEQKETERIKNEAEIAEEKLKIAKIQAASIAHELRTPLGAITFLGSVAEELIPEIVQGYQLAIEAGLIKKSIKDFQLKAFTEIPADLNRIARGANTFIDMLLMKVNLEDQHARAEDLGVFQLGPVIREALEMYPVPESFSRDNIEFTTENDFYVKADMVFIRHIIFNLLKNAIHYVLKAGKGKIYIWMEQAKEFNILHFKDTGFGVQKEVLNHIFDPFFSKTHHGTGVGLTLCSMFMQEFGGNILCDTEAGEYTHFMLQFPKV